jgi:glucose/arabinose dehydrogenase
MLKRLAVVGLGLIACAPIALNATAQNRSWRVEIVKDNLERPWSLNFAPDGRLLFTGRYSAKLSSLDLKSGEVTVLGQLGQGFRPDGEGGMLGMELDPSFAQTGRLYICYSYWRDNQRTDNMKRNRISSFTLSAQGLGNEKALIDDMPGWWNHNGCRVILGPDGMLYVSMGDAAYNPSLAQDLNSKAGKIHRITRDGSTPSDNPFPNSTVWALGSRNAQGLAFQPGTNLLWSTEHGPNTDDELNVIKKGKNYGWPMCRGTQSCNVTNYQPAVKSYSPNDTIAISDMVFYTGNAFPAWKNQLCFVSLKTGRVYRLELDGERVAREEILINNDYGRLRDITMGPDGFLYFSTDNGEQSAIYRIRPQ